MTLLLMAWVLGLTVSSVSITASNWARIVEEKVGAILRADPCEIS